MENRQVQYKRDYDKTIKEIGLEFDKALESITPGDDSHAILCKARGHRNARWCTAKTKYLKQLSTIKTNHVKYRWDKRRDKWVMLGAKEKT
jgi:hypothetical protein